MTGRGLGGGGGDLDNRYATRLLPAPPSYGGYRAARK